jgi:choline kinase
MLMLTVIVVSFPDEAISPLMIAKTKELDQRDYLDLDKTARQYTASVSRKRLSGRRKVLKETHH